MADEKQTRIVITKSPFEPYHPLNLNGRRIKIPVGKATDVPDVFLPLLDDSNVTYEIVEAKGSGEDEASAKGSGDPSSEDKGGSEMSVLDQSIPEATEALDGLSPQQLQELLDAERKGKDRAGMIAAIEGRINATNPAEG